MSVWAQPYTDGEELSYSELLLFQVKRSQLRWFRRLTKMPPGCFLDEVFWAYPKEGDPGGRTRTGWRRGRSADCRLDYCLRDSHLDGCLAQLNTITLVEMCKNQWGKNCCELAVVFCNQNTLIRV